VEGFTSKADDWVDKETSLLARVLGVIRRRFWRRMVRDAAVGGGGGGAHEPLKAGMLQRRIGKAGVFDKFEQRYFVLWPKALLEYPVRKLADLVLTKPRSRARLWACSR
jgi:hypothetical protein